MPHRLREARLAQQARAEEDERHPERRVVGEDAVRPLAVLPSRLAVVGGEDHERPPVAAALQERAEEGLESGVGRGHLSRVGVGGEAPRERLGRRVREVRLIEVDPEEGRGPFAAAQPLEGQGDGAGARPLVLTEPQAVVAGQEAVVVHVEAGREPELRGQREGAHESPRAVAAGLEQGGQRVLALRKAEAAVVPHPVLQRVSAREDIGMRGKGDHVVGVGTLEAHSFAGEAVHPGRGRGRVAARPEGVGPQCVDGDEDHVQAGLALHAPVGPGARGGQQGRRARQDRSPIHVGPVARPVALPPSQPRTLAKSRE